ncbi:MAG TPA: DUF4232 domain-containing protein [Mycobacteriales bacterium]|jgi:hypothetical protein|nr:DUF4232 domain-containing protein [Mycobacteriales bacterium]
MDRSRRALALLSGSAALCLGLAGAAPAGAAPAAAAAPARCHSTQLAGTHPFSEGAAGSVIAHILLTDTSGTSCTVHGYVGALLFGRAGTPLPTTVTREGGEDPTVLLAPGASATALIRYENPDNVPGCRPLRSHWLLVTPPSERLPLLVHSPIGLAPCHGALFTVPVRP